MLYFAYGSNMDPHQMAQRCPASPAVGIGYLADHQLCFPRLSVERGCGVASVRAAPGERAWGVVYRMTEEDLAVLDTYEAYQPGRAAHLNGYNRQTMPVRIENEPVETLIYIAVEQEAPPLPSLAYLTHMRTGARHHGLPADYIALLDAFEHG